MFKWHVQMKVTYKVEPYNDNRTRWWLIKPKLWKLHAYTTQSNKKKHHKIFKQTLMMPTFSISSLTCCPPWEFTQKSGCTSTQLWQAFLFEKVLVSTSIDVRETCTDHTKYKAIKRIHSCILPQKLIIIPKSVMAFKQVHWCCPLLKFLSHLPMLLLLPTFFWSTQKFGVPSTQLWQD